MCEAVAPDWSARLSVRQVGPIVLRAGGVSVHYLLAVLGPRPPSLGGAPVSAGTASTGMYVTGRRDLANNMKGRSKEITHTLP